MEENRIARVLGWYGDHAQRFIAQYAAGDLHTIDERAAKLRVVGQSKSDDVYVCFLGNAGVGKSTLLNALADPKLNILPHGGAGSLTAQATELRYSAQPYLRVSYFGVDRLKGILLNLEKMYAAARPQAAPAPDAEPDLLDDVPVDATDEALLVDAAQEEAAQTGAGRDASNHLERYRSDFKLMVTGDPRTGVDFGYVLDGIRTVIGHRPRWGTTLKPEDAARVQKLRDAVQLATKQGFHREIEARDGNPRTVISEVKDHASGFLAPLIKRLELGWPCEILRDGLVLVDLPGVGALHDKYEDVTVDRLAAARAVVIVTDRAGVTTASTEVLRKKFFNRLLHDADGRESDPITLSVVAVKVDLSANSARADDRQNGIEGKPWVEYFQAVCEDVKRNIREQLRVELGKIAGDGAPETLEARQSALQRWLDTAQVHAVSAVEYRNFNLGDPTMIRTASESNVPQLADALRALAIEHRNRRAEHLRNERLGFAKYVLSTINLVQAMAAENTRAAKEAEQLRADLDDFLGPRTRELDNRNGRFREFLRSTVPTLIDGKVTAASQSARKDIERYLRKVAGFHWATLVAVVRKNGAHVTSAGEQIDLPEELAVRFEQPVAVVWSKDILTEIRRRTNELGQDYVGLVGEVVDWAKGQNARVQARFVEALHENLKAETKDLASVGRDAVDDLKKRVVSELKKDLEDKIRARCQKFVRENKHRGTGVKQRILDELRDEFTNAIVDAAQPVASRVLRGNYDDVQTEISARFENVKNPLERARDVLVQSHEDGVRRSDAQKRRRIIDEASAAVAAFPEEAQ